MDETYEVKANCVLIMGANGVPSRRIAKGESFIATAEELRRMERSSYTIVRHIEAATGKAEDVVNEKAMVPAPAVPTRASLAPKPEEPKTPTGKGGKAKPSR